MINKNLVSQRFSKNLEDYNSEAKIQKQMAEKLFSFLNKNINYGNILEIGCGTGFLTQIIEENLNTEQYDCVDIVPECKNYISKINSDINFIYSDIEEFINRTNNTYDLIISNASLQWIEQFEIFAQKLLSKINQNGILLFSTFGKENFREFTIMNINGLQYFSKEKLSDIFKNYQTNIEEEIRILSFKTPIDVLKHIKCTGVNGIKSAFWTKKDLQLFENNYNNICSGNPTLTYNPIYVSIKK